MKLLIITAVFPPEPVVSAKLSNDIVNCLSEQSEISVISPRPSRPQGFKFSKVNTASEFKHIISDSFVFPKSQLLGRLYESYSFGKFCSNYIKLHHSEIELVYINSWPLISQYLIIKACKRNNLKSVMHIQDIYPESLTNKLPFFRNFLNSLLLPIDKYILKNSTRIVAISHEMEEYLYRTRGIDDLKISVIPNWQDHLEYSFSGEPKEKPFTFMYLGNIGPVAGIDLLIDAFSKLQNNNCNLIIAGAGSMKDKLIQGVKDNNYSNIQFIDVPYGKTGEIQAQADILLLPVKKGAALSSVPSKLPAYMFSKKPIIASVDKTSATAMAITEAKCGWVLEPEDIDTLAEAMNNVLLLNKKTLEKLGDNGFDYGIKTFSKKHNLPKLIEVLYKATIE